MHVGAEGGEKEVNRDPVVVFENTTAPSTPMVTATLLRLHSDTPVTGPLCRRDECLGMTGWSRDSESRAHVSRWPFSKPATRQFRSIASDVTMRASGKGIM